MLEKNRGPLLRLKALRESRGLSQESLARAIDVAKNTVGSYEQGIVTPKTEKFLALCRVLKVSPKTLAQAFEFDITGIPDDAEVDN